MNRTIRQLVTLLRTFADELESILTQTAAGESTSPAKRGRPKKEEQVNPVETPTPTAEPKEEATGMTLDALKALIEPAVKAGAGAQVKSIISKHGGTQLSSIPAANHAAFAADVEGLVY